MVRDMIACGCTDYSNPEMVVEDSEKSGEASSKIKTLDIKRGNFILLKEPVDGISLWTALKSKGAKRLTDLQEQPPQRRQVYPITQKVEQALQKTSMYEKGYILTELKWKKRKYPESGSRDGLPRRNTEPLLKHAVVELEKPRLSWIRRYRRKGFYRYINSKRKTIENVTPLLNGPGN